MNTELKCDCMIGFLSGEKIYKSNIDYEVQKILNIQPVFKKYGILKIEPQTKKQILDARKGYLNRFNFCPYCSHKINWKEIVLNCLK